ncbi:hypothetical protein [Moellerella wisconsensis]|nr:hypothetical protein [Moellerella wisconsensis]
MMKRLPASIPLYIGLTTQKSISALKKPLKQYHCPHWQNKLTLENNYLDY